MNVSSENNPFSFEEAARLIAESESDAAWLAYGLRFFIWPQDRWTNVMREKFGPGLGMFAALDGERLGRAEVIRALSKTLPEAIETVLTLSCDYTLSRFITDPALGPGFTPIDHVALVKLLCELRRRCDKAAKSPGLLTTNGKAKAGKNKALAPGQLDAKLACVGIVIVAWKFVRDGVPPGPRTRNAAKAAEMLFALGSAKAGRYEQVKPTRRGSWGTNPLGAWRQYFEAAALPNPGSRAVQYDVRQRAGIRPKVVSRRSLREEASYDVGGKSTFLKAEIAPSFGRRYPSNHSLASSRLKSRDPARFFDNAMR